MKKSAQGILISLVKCQGDRILYGHNFANPAFIGLKIDKAEQYRDLQKTRYRAKKNILEAHLSFSQFAELITSFNTAPGTPATLYRLGQDQYAEPELTDESLSVKNEGKQELLEAIAEIDKAITAVKNQKITKKAESAILEPLYQSRRKLQDSFPCVQKFFEERIDKLQSDARVEIASYLALAIESRGLQNLGNPDKTQLFLPNDEFGEEK